MRKTVALFTALVMFFSVWMTDLAPVMAAVTIPEDGKITIQAEDFDDYSHRPEVGPPKVMNDGSAYTGSGYVGDFHAGSILTYEIDVQVSAVYQVALRVGTTTSSTVKISSGNEWAAADIPSTGGWQNYTQINLQIQLEEGIQNFVIENLNGVFNIDRMDFSLNIIDFSIEAEDYDFNIGGKVMDNNPSGTSGGKYVGDFYSGSLLGYKVDVANAGYYEAALQIAAPTGGSVSVGSNGRGSVSSDFNSNGGSWQAYETVKVNLWLDEGEQELLIENLDQTWNFDKMDFTRLMDSLEDVNFAPWSLAGSSSGDAAAAIDEDLQSSWYADGTEGEYMVVRFDASYAFDTVILYDAPGSHITAGTLVFSDGSSVEVGALSSEGTEIQFDRREAHWVMFWIKGVSAETQQAGLAGFEIYGDVGQLNAGMDYGLQAYVRHNGKFAHMADCLAGGVTIKGDSLQMMWSKNIVLNGLTFAGLPDSLESLSGTLQAGDQIIEVNAVIQNGIAFIAIDSVITDSLTLRIDGLDSDSLLTVPVIQATSSGTHIDVLQAARYQVYIYDRYKNFRMAEEEGMLKYAASGTDQYGADSAIWDIIPIQGKDTFLIRNYASGGYITLTGDVEETSVLPEADDNEGALWQLVTNGDWYNIYNVKYPSRALHIEYFASRPNEVLAGSINSDWQSAMWNFTAANTIAPDEHEYYFTYNSVEGTAGRAVAYTDKKITATNNGKTRSWSQTRDISHMPEFTSDNLLANAVYNLTMEEAEKSIFMRNNMRVFNTGVSWQHVWTRDTAISVEYSLGWLYPDVSENSLRYKIIEDINVFEQDTGTGGSYPTSVDKIIMMIAAWETYLANDDKQFIADMYQTASNTIEQDDHVVLDPEIGLYKGETGGLDWRSQTYPDWFDTGDFDTLINIAESYSSIVNVVYCEVMSILSRSAKILGKDAEAVEWERRSAQLSDKINEYFWLENRGMYASFIYPEYMGRPVADKVDVISNGYALLYNIADDDKAEQILKNYPMVVYGAPTVWPQKDGNAATTVYHNRGVWPGWEVALMEGAKARGNLQLAEEIWNSCVRNAAMNTTNKEVVDFTTGDGTYSDQQLWSLAGTLAGYLKLICGLQYSQEGITFSPYVPEWIGAENEMKNYTYLDSTLHIKVTGTGDTLESLVVDGVSQPLDYIFPSGSTGEHTIEMIVSDSGKRSEVNIQPISWVTCPDLPTLNYDEKAGTLNWETDARYTYLLWNGSEFINVTGRNTYPVSQEGYAVYSLAAVDADGVTSELARPVMINQAENIIIVEAEAEGNIYNPANLQNSIAGYSGTGYITDYYSNNTADGVTLKVNVPQTGIYMFSGVYNNKGDAQQTTHGAIRSLYVDGVDTASIIFPLSWNQWDRSSYVNLYLEEGDHEITIKFDDANWYDRNMNREKINNVSYDYFKLEYRGSEVIDHTELLTLIQNGKKLLSLDKALYVDEDIITALQEAVDAAEEVYHKSTAGNANQAEINTAVNTLKKAIEEFNAAADKVLLAHYLAEAKAADTSKLPPSMLKIFNAAVDAAEVLMAEKNADQEDVDDTVIELIKALALLVYEQGDKQQLQNLYDHILALKLEEKDYQSGWQQLQNALNETGILLEKEDVLQEKYNEAYQKLWEAYSNLKGKDWSKLYAAIQLAQKLLADDDAKYISSQSKEKLETALQNAEKLVEAGNAGASQSDIDGLYTRLIEALRVDYEVSQDILEDILNKTKETGSLDQYTESSAAVYLNALEAANTIMAEKNIFNSLADAKAYEGRLLEAAEALQKAYDALTKKDPDSTDATDDTDSTDDQTGSTDTINPTEDSESTGESKSNTRPSSSKTGSGSGKQGGKKTAPATGDSSSAVILLALTAGSLVLLASIKKRKSNT